MTNLHVLTPEKIDEIRNFAHEYSNQLADMIYFDPDVPKSSKNTEVLLAILSECQRRATLMSSYALNMNRFIENSGEWLSLSIYDSFINVVDTIVESIKNLLVENAWTADDQVDEEFNSFLWELSDAYFNVRYVVYKIQNFLH